MKKVLIVGAIFVVAVAALAIGGFAYAQSQNPPRPEVPYGPGMMQGWMSEYGPGMMNGQAQGFMHGRGGAFGRGAFGQLKEYMDTALAEAFGLTVDELQSTRQEGKTLWDIAKEQGLTVAEYQEKMTQARDKALELAVADGAITQEQADQAKALKERAQERRDQMGAMHDLMSAAVAAEFGLTVEELDAMHAEGKTLMDLASEQGLTVEEFESKMQTARSKALEQAVADGIITQEQADWMLEHMGPKGMMGGLGRGGFGSGGCGGGGMRGRGTGPGMRWFTPPAGPTS